MPWEQQHRRAASSKGSQSEVQDDMQVAARAQRASVQTSEVQRYIDYDARHGARYMSSTSDQIDEDDW